MGPLNSKTCSSRLQVETPQLAQFRLFEEVCGPVGGPPNEKYVRLPAHSAASALTPPSTPASPAGRHRPSNDPCHRPRLEAIVDFHSPDSKEHRLSRAPVGATAFGVLFAHHSRHEVTMLIRAIDVGSATSMRLSGRHRSLKADFDGTSKNRLRGHPPRHLEPEGPTTSSTPPQACPCSLVVTSADFGQKQSRRGMVRFCASPTPLRTERTTWRVRHAHE